ncbi:MAG: transglycosylase domain-containing protein [Parcubacteria group bacterium]|nr:transglycosylase domain-containing protein [Parcubacteria group bacterium]
MHKFLFFFVSIALFFSGTLLIWGANLRIPDLATFEERRVPESTKIYDRTGAVLLYDLHKDIQREVVPFDEISRDVKNATVAIEDAGFYEHKGVLPSAIFRAILVNIVASKEKILEMYLNEIPYGGSVYGIEEASRVYLGKKAAALSLAESAYLAALPQAPTYYSPYGNNKEKLAERKNLVLKRMFEEHFITEEEYTGALAEEVLFAPYKEENIKAPHFVFYVIETVEKKMGKEAVESGGLKIITTIDYELQKKAEDIVKTYSEENRTKFNANNAGLVALDPKTGQILVMVGSRDYHDMENEGNFNVTISPNRQPGSAFKPFVYETAFEKGFTPETVVFDLETQFDINCDAEGKPREGVSEEYACYTPKNYDEIFRGPITLREALAQSINIPAIKTLYLAGLADSLRTAQKMGITSLVDINRYGLTLVLGGGEVSLLEMTGAYSVFANEGKKNPIVSILKIEDKNGAVLEEYRKREERVIPEKTALQVSHILKDNDARAPAFGEWSQLYFPGRDVAAKTGTTNDYKDAWIIGYTPTIAVGAWAGNNDYTAMEKKVAGFIVAPLWNAFMQEALKTLPDEPFKNISIAADTNLKPILRGIWLGGETYKIDKISGNLATVYTPVETLEEKVVPNIHSILYWVNKDDIRGPQPKNPEKDPQFELWETSVQKWVEKQGFDFNGFKIPSEEDGLHKPELAPGFTVEGINREYPLGGTVSFSVKASGSSSLSKVDLFINDVYLTTVSNRPFDFSLHLVAEKNIQKENTLTVVVYDPVFNKSSQKYSFTIRDI